MGGVPLPKNPLIEIDLILDDNNKPRYSTIAQQVFDNILEILKKGIKNLNGISCVDQKLLPHLFNTKSRNFLNCTILSEKDVDEENKWVYDEFIKLKTQI